MGAVEVAEEVVGVAPDAGLGGDVEDGVASGDGRRDGGGVGEVASDLRRPSAASSGRLPGEAQDGDAAIEEARHRRGRRNRCHPSIRTVFTLGFPNSRTDQGLPRRTGGRGGVLAGRWGGSMRRCHKIGVTIRDRVRVEDLVGGPHRNRGGGTPSGRRTTRVSGTETKDESPKSEGRVRRDRLRRLNARFLKPYRWWLVVGVVGLLAQSVLVCRCRCCRVGSGPPRAVAERAGRVTPEEWRGACG